MRDEANANGASLWYNYTRHQSVVKHRANMLHPDDSRRDDNNQHHQLE